MTTSVNGSDGHRIINIQCRFFRRDQNLSFFVWNRQIWCFAFHLFCGGVWGPVLLLPFSLKIDFWITNNIFAFLVQRMRITLVVILFTNNDLFLSHKISNDNNLSKQNKNLSGNWSDKVLIAFSSMLYILAEYWWHFQKFWSMTWINIFSNIIYDSCIRSGTWCDCILYTLLIKTCWICFPLWFVFLQKFNVSILIKWEFHFEWIDAQRTIS